MNSTRETVILEQPIELRDLEPFIETVFASGSRLMFYPKGRSMEPFLHDRREKIVLVRPAEKGDYRKGDIIFYKRENGSFILHRIVGERRDGFVLCGDAQTVREFGIRPDQVIARVEGFYRGRRLIDCRKNLRYRFLASLWVFLLPVRRGLLILRHPIRKAGSFLRRHFSSKRKPLH